MKKRVIHSLRKLTIAFGTVAAFTIPSTAHSNGLQHQLNGLFDSMVNVTQPGVFETQRRGVIAGGRFTVKNRIFTESIVNFTPPGAKGGCGGIDLFGGSFSFINSEQLTQLFRAIAANAAGYAFQLALSNMCPLCMNVIAKLQDMIQKLNQHLGNSCQLAQGLVNDVSNLFAYDIKHKTDASLTGTFKGLFSDSLEATAQLSGTSPTKELHDRDPESMAELRGNLMWQQFQRNSIQYWFSGGDTELMETIMSLTGTVIVKDPEPDPKQPAGSNDVTQDIVTLPGQKIKLSDFIDGGKISIYSCAGDTIDCMSAGETNKEISIIGVKQQIWDLLLGANNAPGQGIIGKFARNSGQLTETEQAFMSNMPVALGTIVRNLSVLSEQSARMFVHESAGSIALVMTHHLAEELFRASHAALANSKSSYKAQAAEALRTSQSGIRTEYAALLNQYGSMSEQLEKYNAVLANVRKQQYMVRSLSAGTR